MNAPAIGRHLAGLNLFREPDGSVEITVADARGAIAEIVSAKPNEAIAPSNYVDRLIVEAAKNIVARRPDLKPEASDLAVAIGEHAFAAGFEAGADWGAKRVGYRPSALAVAWSAYDPPEELKGRDFQ